MNAAPSSASAVIPLDKLLLGSLALLQLRWGGLRAALTLPFIGNAAWSVLDSVAPELAQRMAPGALLLMVALHVVLAVQVQRLVLLGEGSIPAHGFVGWTLREWRYLSWFWLQMVGAFVGAFLAAPALLLGGPGVVVCLLAASWGCGRIALMLPGLAVDRPVPFKTAWRMGRGLETGLRLALLAGVLPFVGGLLPGVLLTADLLPLRIVGTGLSLLCSAWFLAAMALLWRSLAAGDGGEIAPRVLRPPKPDPVRGLLHLQGREPLSKDGEGGEVDALRDYRGRIRGLVLELLAPPELADAPQADPEAIGAWLRGYGALDAHFDAVTRVAVVARPAWSAVPAALEARFPQAELRWFPANRGDRAERWAAGEE